MIIHSLSQHGIARELAVITLSRKLYQGQPLSRLAKSLFSTGRPQAFSRCFEASGRTFTIATMDLIEKTTNCKASKSACNSLQMNSPGSGDELLNHSAHITLTPRETRLRDLLLDVARYIDESKVVKERLELRFAGGWVRDKLLHMPSNDIDTVINAMTGYAFSLKMKEYLECPENLKKHGLGESDIGNLHKIAANPEKSKHLETVTTKMLGFDVDFVNLRKETYSADSRNPQMEFGTAKEDALRRDATINALFYNIHTDKVEDSVGGVHDLQAKLIRTPVEPYQTFIDDPLRVLRLIRFASRLDFKIDKETEASMADQAIMDAIKLKISRERVGVEVEKMLKGKDPRRSLELFDRLGLYSTIFTNPMTNNQPQPLTDRWKFSYNCLEVMRLNQSPRSLYKLLVCSYEATELAWILSALSPWANVPMPPLSKQTTKALLPQATLVAREGIKLNNRMCETVTGAFKHVKEISRFKKAVNDQEPWTREPDVLGMAIQRWDAAGGHWKLHVLLAVLVEAMQSVECDDFETILSTWHKFLDHLQEMEIFDAPSWKRLVDGRQLSNALGIKPGKWMAAALQVCMAWQFRNPKETNPAGAIEEVKSKWQELDIPDKSTGSGD